MGSSAPPETNCVSWPEYVTGMRSGASPELMTSDFLASQSLRGALVRSKSTLFFSASWEKNNQSSLSG